MNVIYNLDCYAGRVSKVLKRRIISLAVSPTPNLHNHTARVLLLRLCYTSISASLPPTGQRRVLTIKHLTLRTQPITLRHQIINLLPSLQHTLNRLMQHNLCLIQLLLNLHNTIRLLRILVLHDIILQLREIQCRVRVREGGAGVRGEEFVDDFREQLVRD